MASFTVEVLWHNGDGEDITELYGSYLTYEKAEAEAARVNKALDRIPVAESWVGGRSVRASAKSLRPLRIRPIVEEAHTFLENDDGGPAPDSYSAGMYSIDHGN